MTDIVSNEEIAAYLAGTGRGDAAAASAAVRDYCGWHITPEVTETIKVRSRGGTAVVLPTLKVATVTSVTFAGSPLDAWDWSSSGVLDRAAGWPVGLLEVTLTHGFASAPAVRDVVLSVAARASAAPVDGRTSLGVGGVSAAYGSAANMPSAGITLYASDRARLASYRLPSLP